MVKITEEFQKNFVIVLTIYTYYQHNKGIKKCIDATPFSHYVCLSILSLTIPSSLLLRKIKEVKIVVALKVV